MYYHALKLYKYLLTKYKASPKAMTDFPITREDATYAVIYGALFAIGAIANAIVIVVLGKG